MTAELVSIIIPAHNYGRYLTECVESIFAQTWPHWEVIIVDDASTDTTPEIAAQLKERTPGKIFYHRVSHLGVAEARNHALLHARGEYILPLDADDMLHPDAIELMITAIRKDPQIGFVYSALQNYGALPGESEHWFPGTFRKEHMLQENLAACTSLWKRSLWSAGVKYRAVIFEDWDLWLQCVERGLRGEYLPQVLLRYRMNQQGAHIQNRFRALQAQLQEMSLFPNLYSPELAAWSAQGLIHAPECFSRPSLVICPQPGSPASERMQGELLTIAQTFLDRGHFVVWLGTFTDATEQVPGIVQLRVPAEVTPESISSRLMTLGREVITLSDTGAAWTSEFRRAPNVYSIVSFGADFDSNADLHVQISGNTFTFDIRLAVTSIPGTVHSARDFAECVLKIHGENVSLRQGIGGRFRKTLSNLAGRSREYFLLHPAPHTSQNEATVIIASRGDDPAVLERTLAALRTCPEACAIQLVISEAGSISARLRQMVAEYGVQLSSGDPSAFLSDTATPWAIVLRDDIIVDRDFFKFFRRYLQETGDRTVFLAEYAQLFPLPDHALPGSEIPASWLAERRYRPRNPQPGAIAFRPRDFTDLAWEIMKQALQGSPGRLTSIVEQRDRHIVWLQRDLIFRQWQVPRHPVTKDFQMPLGGWPDQKLQARILTETAEKLLQAQDLPAAVETFEMASALRPDDITATLGLARSLLARGQLPLASHFARVALALDPDNLTARNLLHYYTQLEAR